MPVRLAPVSPVIARMATWSHAVVHYGSSLGEVGDHREPSIGLAVKRALSLFDAVFGPALSGMPTMHAISRTSAMTPETAARMARISRMRNTAQSPG